MPVKLGFIGFGIMGERLLRAALAHDPASLVVSGIFDPSPTAAARLAAISATPAAFASPADVIAASDVLHIASPPSSHLDYLMQCEEAGRAALCEKPLATNVESAAEVVAELVKRNARVGVNFPFASSLAVDQLEQWIAEGAVGTPASVAIEVAFAAWPRSWQRDAIAWLDGRADGGFTREVVSHFLFLSRRMFGPLMLDQATCSYPEAGRSERAITARLQAGSMPVTVAGSVGTTPKDDHNTWTLTGDKGRIRLRDWSFAEREVGGAWQQAPDALPNEKARPLVLARQLDKVAALTRGEKTNLATLEDAFDVQRVVETVLKSS